jgi:hypothetical protein
MNKCIDPGIQEMLPDLLNRTLDAARAARVETHVAGCEACNEELDVLRTVKSAAVFAPAIDVESVVRKIAPYRKIVPASQLPARSRAISWLVAAALMIVVGGGGSLLIVQQKPALTGVPKVDSPAARPSKNSPAPSVVASNQAKSGPPAAAHTLALAAGVDVLSDSDLRQLMSDMDNFDALPTTEPEPVINVDNGDNPAQDF